MRFEDWLALREPADAAARSRELVELLPPAGSHVIHDLGCGTGSMGRWLAPLLPGPQHWILHDRDPDLLAVAAATGGEPRQSDITRLDPSDLPGATLITASALLDMLTGDELTRLVRLCVDAGCPALLTLSVVGRVELTPADPLDRRVEAAFNDHQRRGGRLGPDAPGVAREQFEQLGAQVIARPSPWRLGPAQAELAAQWFSGWVGAAREQDPELAAATGAYTRASAVVHHADLLVLPRSGG